MSIRKLEKCLCGSSAEFERMGTSYVSCIITCEDCGLRLETGEEGEMCGRIWNERFSKPRILKNALKSAKKFIEAYKQNEEEHRAWNPKDESELARIKQVLRMKV